MGGMGRSRSVTNVPRPPPTDGLWGRGGLCGGRFPRLDGRIGGGGALSLTEVGEEGRFGGRGGGVSLVLPVLELAGEVDRVGRGGGGRL